MKNQTIFQDLGGNLIYITHFGIATGEKSGYYTLRAYGTKRRFERTELGTVESASGAEDASVYIKNLSTDKVQALEAARAYIAEYYPSDKLDERINFDLDEIERISREQAEAARAAEAARIAGTDYSVFQSGKYQGRKVAEIVVEDRRYCDWFSTAFRPDSDNGRTAAIINELLAPERDAAREAQQRRLNALISEIGADRLSEWAKGSGGNFLCSIAQNIRSGSLPSGRGLDILLEILAKDAGRKNSAAYYKRLEELGSVFI